MTCQTAFKLCFQYQHSPLQLGFNERDLHGGAAAETHVPWELQLAHVSGPEVGRFRLSRGEEQKEEGEEEEEEEEEEEKEAVLTAP